MSKRWVVIFGALGLFGVALAQSSCKHVTCESVCEDRNACEGQQQNPDCNTSCDSQIQSADKSGCKSQFDSLVACQGAVDVCTSDTFCTAQSAAYLKCVMDACSKDPSTCS